MRRLLGALLVTTTLLFLAGCGEDAPDPVAQATDSASAPATEPTRTSASAGAEELPPGWDEPGDGPSPTPDAALDDAALTALLRTRAAVRAGTEHCRPDQVEVDLRGYDQAAGHRYTSIAVRNTSRRACTLAGVPGIGARGGLGHTFVPEVDAADEGTTPVRIEPGDYAAAGLEWTGELAGAESERVSLLVVQLAAGQVPVPVAPRLVNDPAAAEALDIGQLTTIHLSAFAPLSRAEAARLAVPFEDGLVRPAG